MAQTQTQPTNSGQSLRTPTSDVLRDRFSSWSRGLADRLGICLSSLCLIHCLLAPLVLLLPSLGFLQIEEWFHGVLLIAAPLVALLAFIPGYRRHQNKMVFVWSSAGFVLFIAAVAFFEHGSILGATVSVLGSLLMIRAHLFNRRLCACCETHPHIFSPRSSLSRGSRTESTLELGRVQTLSSSSVRRLLSPPRRREKN
jgi:hypothetical protein